MAQKYIGTVLIKYDEKSKVNIYICYNVKIVSSGNA